jgi:hypothetical protein
LHQTRRLDHAANPKSPTLGGFTGKHLSGGEEENQVALKSVEHQCSDAGQNGQAQSNEHEFFLSFGHGVKGGWGLPVFMPPDSSLGVKGITEVKVALGLDEGDLS